jgi:tRNA (Thr-GGU) A37 N-methylase
MEIKLAPIGTVHSPYKSIEEIKQAPKEEVVGEIEIFQSLRKD